MKNTTNNGPRTETPALTEAARRNLDEIGMCEEDVADDVEAVAAGRRAPSQLLDLCLDGADPDRERGWREYVDAVAVAAKVR